MNTNEMCRCGCNDRVLETGTTRPAKPKPTWYQATVETEHDGIPHIYRSLPFKATTKAEAVCKARNWGELSAMKRSVKVEKTS